jgi:hypothetical protein
VTNSERELSRRRFLRTRGRRCELARRPSGKGFGRPVLPQPWTPKRPGKYELAVRATDEKDHTQPDQPIWNPGGYLWNRIERHEITVGSAA